MPDPTNFLDDENSHRGYYELAVDLGDRSDPDGNEHLLAVRVALWAAEDLDGPYLDRWSRPSEQDHAQLEPSIWHSLRVLMAWPN